LKRENENRYRVWVLKIVSWSESQLQFFRFGGSRLQRKMFLPMSIRPSHHKNHGRFLVSKRVFRHPEEKCSHPEAAMRGSKNIDKTLSDHTLLTPTTHCSPRPQFALLDRNKRVAKQKQGKKVLSL